MLGKKLGIRMDVRRGASHLDPDSTIPRDLRSVLLQLKYMVAEGIIGLMRGAEEKIPVDLVQIADGAEVALEVLASVGEEYVLAGEE